MAVLAVHRLERDRLVVSRPALFDRLSRASRVTQLSAPAGSGKTHLLRSWIRETGLAASTAWVSVEREEQDPERFWLSLVEALNNTWAGAGVLPEPHGMSQPDPRELAERLGMLEHPVRLVIDGVEELRSEAVLDQLESFLRCAPDGLRIVLSSRHEPRLGLHRLRLEGALTELRWGDLAFTEDETRELLSSAGVELSDSALATLLERTEGWVAGLRLAALSLAGHPDPERFAVEFSGSERTVADYLSAEVLDRQPADARRLLVRTSVLERVNGPLAERLTGEHGAERILHDLAEAGAFVVPLDASRTWFRFHRLFADLLKLELRRKEPDAPGGLHRAAAEWLGEHGHPVEAVGHARAAGDWSLAARIVSDHWFGLELGGQASPEAQVLSAVPSAAVVDDAELAAVIAAEQLLRGAPQEVERYRSLAHRALASLPAERSTSVMSLLARVRLLSAHTGRELQSAIEEAHQLLEAGEPAGDALSLDSERRALTLITLGSAELLAGEVEDAERHLEEGSLLARWIEQTYLEIFGVSWSAQLASLRSPALGIERATRAIELARQHGWSEEPIVSPAYAAVAAGMVWQGRLEEAQSVLEHLDSGVRLVGPLAGAVQYARDLLELARDRDKDAVQAFDGSVSVGTPQSRVSVLLREALACDAQGDELGAGLALEHSLDLAEPDGLLLPFLIHPAAVPLLRRHSRYRTTHASLISDALALSAGSQTAKGAAERHELSEPLSECETRVLRYLPTNLSKQEIADELCVSVHTVKTHIHHLYNKLGVHCRRDAVVRGRTLGLVRPG